MLTIEQCDIGRYRHLIPQAICQQLGFKQRVYANQLDLDELDPYVVVYRRIERYLEGRADLGNTQPGDGSKYRGRGLIQITGRANYRDCGEALNLDLINHPELLEKPQHACQSAAWFWSTRGLNTLADQNKFDTITRRINGGQNGAADRQALHDRALQVLA